MLYTSRATPPTVPLSSSSTRSFSSENTAPGAVDQSDTLFQLAGVGFGDQSAGFIGQRGVHRNEIAGGEQLLNVNQPHAHFLGFFMGGEGVIGDDVHAEGIHPFRNTRADFTQANDAQYLARKLGSGVLFTVPGAVFSAS